ncbi:MAG: tryptophan synthase subunit alpha [Actinobacteria bacterium]|nr:MAG: tryptophan synthase subunit alpha [Actinomycetota bacterium]TML80279.1 MAG: tryptophan synthase subunit alpha [Actinomycetota bacterium]
MPYLMGGFPDVQTSLRVGVACAEAGADLVELGIPFSDPLADGPVIHAAGTHALAAGVTPGDVLGVCEELSERIPVVLMVYANLVLTGGAEAFVQRAAAAGAAGLIVPDLPHDEAGELRAACDRHCLALVPLVAPTTTPERIGDVGGDARGFVYTVSVTGTTGERNELPPELERTVDRVRAATRLPVAVGFGIASAEQASRVADLADGVIVGSRLVRAAGEGGPRAVGEAVAELSAALR